MSTISIMQLFHIRSLSPPKGLTLGGLLFAFVLSNWFSSVTWASENTNLIINGDFEATDCGSYITVSPLGSSSIPGWKVTYGTVDCVGTYFVAAEGRNSVDLGGNENGSISQTFSTTIGNNYQITFDMAGNPCSSVTKVMSVSVAGESRNFQFEMTGQSHQNMGWLTKSFTFTATESQTTLTFTQLEGKNCGMAIDNVRVVSATGTTTSAHETLSSYLGCFKDNDQADPHGTNGRDLSGIFLEDNNMTTELCMASCQGFAYAATQYGNACFCGNGYGRYGKASNCDMSCSGNSGQVCGGFWANSVYKVQTDTSSSYTLPILDHCHATDSTGKTVTTTTVMEGGNSVNGKTPEKQVKQKLFDTVDIKGNITVDPVDIGQFVDIFIYAAATFPGSKTVTYFMLGPGLTILVWDQNPANLIAFSNASLGMVQTVPMYSGTFFYPGTLKIFFGYRLFNGITITSGEPIEVTIDE